MVGILVYGAENVFTRPPRPSPHTAGVTSSLICGGLVFVVNRQLFFHEKNKNKNKKLCLEEGEATALASLEHAAELFNLRQIDMSAFPPPPPTERSLSSPISRAAEVEDAAAHTEDAKQASHSRSKRSKTSAADDNTAAAGGGAAAVGPTLRDSAAFVSAAQPVAAVGIHAPRALSSDASRDDRDRRVARVAAFNNRAVLLIAAGRGTEACRLLRSCLLILPGEPRPAFNLALALWRLGRPRLACSHWLEARGWGGELGRGGDLEMLSRLLESARRRKVVCATVLCFYCRAKNGDFVR